MSDTDLGDLIVQAIPPQLAVFFDGDALREPEPLYRFDGPAGRYYYRFPEGQKPVIFPSVTTVNGAQGPTSKYLVDWISDHGKRRADALKDEAAAYGTAMHAVFGDFLVAREMDLDGLDIWVENWATRMKLPWDTSRWAEKLRQDAVGIADFMRDWNFKPVCVEVPLADNEAGYAGTLDLGAYILGVDSPGVYIVDFKSNRKAFYDDNGTQLGAYGRLWRKNFPDRPVKGAVCWGAKDWDASSRDRYRQKIYSPLDLELLERRFLRYLEGWYDDQKVRPKQPIITGKLSLDEPKALTYETFEEMLARRHGIVLPRLEVK